MNFYDLEVKKPNGELIKMSDYAGKAVLIVNTATKCGLTPQFDGLEKLHQFYKDKGLVVLGFPCNQFLFQEPLSNDNMEESCRINHGVTFQLTEKVKVNGMSAHPVYKFLKKSLPVEGITNRIRWNFEKFLITPEGIPFKRYSPKTTPDKLTADIDELLAVKVNA